MIEVIFGCGIVIISLVIIVFYQSDKIDKLKSENTNLKLTQCKCSKSTDLIKS